MSFLKKQRGRGVFIIAIVAVLAIGAVFALQANKDADVDGAQVGSVDGDRVGSAGGSGAGTSLGTSAKASGTMTLGFDGAPITVIEYSDFQCPYCGIFARDIQPQLIEQYVDTGRVRFEWRNMPIFGRFSQEAALGSLCADDQNAFWPYHDAVYETVGNLSQSEKNVDTLVKIAGSLDLDTKEFRACIEDGRHFERVRTDYEEGRSLGLTGTPSFMANGILVIGAQPMETWHKVFEMLGEQ